MTSTKEALAVRTWAECVAGSMSDPVKRLRFIRTVAPLTNIWGDRRGRWRRATVATILVVPVVGALVGYLYARAAVPPVPAPPSPPAAEVALAGRLPAAEVWLVDHTAAADSYSNGLQIDNTFAVDAPARSYLAFPLSGDAPPQRRIDPAGIVFHGTESQQIAFEAGHNEALKRIGESLVDYVRRRRSYHFVIDRFGRVHRIVVEAGVAGHAGYSVWSDSRWLYLNLNESFFGVAFEARTAPRSDGLMTAAQTRSAAMLVEMLRSRYRIPASNCVTHAQVSVNPSNMRIGYHVDWASDFPFRDLGLPDNYATPVPAIWRLGFDADPALRRAIPGVAAAEVLLSRQAAGRRKQLHREYRDKLAAVRHAEALK
jgi:hypothetical protein